MSAPILDLRSDTVTRPSAGMRRAMASAEVGDDVYGEDPTVRRLESRVASLLGKEAALFVPSGTMANQLAIRAHTVPGDEAIVEARGHSFAFESGGMAGLAGVQARPVVGERGILSAAAIEAAINPAPDHFAHTRLVLIENTSNFGGGTLYPLDGLDAIGALCRARGLSLHLDGARLWNAHVASGIALDRLARDADSVSVCLSKGLGAPVGSVVAGSARFVTRVHRLRKMYGGGMRQVGILAAAGLYALDHHLEGLAEDHARLRRLASGLAELPGLACDPEAFPTNIAFVEVTGGRAASAVEAALARHGVRVHATGPTTLRFVTHRDLDDADIEAALVRTRAALAEEVGA